MEETEVAQTAPAVKEVKNNVKQLSILKRLLLGVGFTLLGVIGTVSGVMVGLTTVALVPAFLNMTVFHPVFAVAMFAYYLISTVVFGLVAGTAFHFAYKILKKQSVEQHWKMVFAMSLILAIVSWALSVQLRAFMEGLLA